MSDRTIWIVRIIAVFVFLLLAYLMMDLYARLRKMSDERGESRGAARLQIADCRLQITEPGRTIRA